MCMETDVFAEYSYGKIALRKMGPVDPNFRLYLAGYLGKGNERDCMEVKGAVFRHALRGPNKGRLSVMVPGTEKTAYVTADEMRVFDKKK